MFSLFEREREKAWYTSKVMVVYSVIFYLFCVIILFIQLSILNQPPTPTIPRAGTRPKKKNETRKRREKHLLMLLYLELLHIILILLFFRTLPQTQGFHLFLLNLLVSTMAMMQQLIYLLTHLQGDGILRLLNT